jgi:predicted unusual protein kinase regulating ubiquinone biosynthesis (AarF/ABC1/UbiB family)
MKESAARVKNVLTASSLLVARVAGNVERLIEELSWDSGRVAAEAQALYGELTAAGQAARLAVRATPRFARIVAEGAAIAVAYRVFGARPSVHEESAERIYRLCVELRGALLKLGQFASSRVDLLPPPFIRSLSRLQDRVPPVATGEIRARIEAELARPIDELFRRFDDEPLAAASLAQVHAAELGDGTPVAVKVQVPGIEEHVEADLAALKVLAAGLADRLPAIDLPTIAAELSRAVVAELDYQAEAAAAEAIGADFAGDPEVVVPRVHRALSTRRVLVLERLDGARLVDWLDAAAPAERDRLLATLVRAYAAQILRHGRFQADAHPGNFLVLPGPRLALLDFGCVKQLDAEARAGWLRLVLAILGRDAAGMAASFASLGFRTKGDDPAALVELAELVMGAFREGADLSALDPAEQIARGLEILGAHPLVELPEDFVLLGRVLASLGGLFVKYRPNLSLFALVAPYLA